MIFDHLSPDSRVWLFIANQKISSSKIQILNTEFKKFCETWKSHGIALTGELKFFEDQLIAFGVFQQNLCGRSVDALIRFIRETEHSLKLDLLNRNRIGYLKNNSFNVFLFQEMKNLKSNYFIHENTMITNNFIENNKENLFIPLSQSPFKA